MIHKDTQTPYSEVEGLSVLLGFRTANAGCCKAGLVIRGIPLQMADTVCLYGIHVPSISLQTPTAWASSMFLNWPTNRACLKFSEWHLPP